MNLVKRESASNGDCHWAWKLKPDRVADAGVHFLRDRIHGEHNGDREIEREGRGDEEEPLAVGSQMEDEEKAATDEKRDGEREGRARDGLREGGRGV